MKLNVNHITHKDYISAVKLATLEDTNPIGAYLERIAFLETKYNFSFSIDAVNKNIIRLTNQLWKLIPMKENNEDWEKQLNTVILEIAGMNEVFAEQSPQLLQLLTKLEGLRTCQDICFELYRKTVFESINLLQGMKLS